ncbi:MAG: DUF4340 domain-containing protein [bacterium]|nr:DUF4340 domain-containing protein [bacterium]
MHWRQVVVLWLVCLALGAWWWRGEAPPAAEPGDGRPRFLRLVPDELIGLRVARGGRALVVARTGTQWTVVEPSGAAVPGDLVTAFVRALAEAEEIDRTTAPDDRRAFGLDERATAIELRLADGSTVALTLGGPNPTGTAIYAMRAGDDGVVVLGRQLRTYEDLLFQALPSATVPPDAAGERVGAQTPLTGVAGQV